LNNGSEGPEMPPVHGNEVGVRFVAIKASNCFLMRVPGFGVEVGTLIGTHPFSLFFDIHDTDN
jgi:hypothetical protein